MAGLSIVPITEAFPQRSRLNSWKEIAVYLDRGVRTVQRWEQELGLPVYRIAKNDRGPVFAYCHEIDRWLEACAKNPQLSRVIAQPALARQIALKHSPEVWDQIRNCIESIRTETQQLHKLIEKLRVLIKQDSTSQLLVRPPAVDGETELGS
jgi:hypothetical protein